MIKTYRLKTKEELNEEQRCIAENSWYSDNLSRTWDIDLEEIGHNFKDPDTGFLFNKNQLIESIMPEIGGEIIEELDVVEDVVEEKSLVEQMHELAFSGKEETTEPEQPEIAVTRSMIEGGISIPGELTEFVIPKMNIQFSSVDKASETLNKFNKSLPSYESELSITVDTAVPGEDSNCVCSFTVSCKARDLNQKIQQIKNIISCSLTNSKDAMFLKMRL